MWSFLIQNFIRNSLLGQLSLFSNHLNGFDRHCTLHGQLSPHCSNFWNLIPFLLLAYDHSEYEINSILVCISISRNYLENKLYITMCLLWLYDSCLSVVTATYLNLSYTSLHFQ
jgi:hypothetical protein